MAIPRQKIIDATTDDIRGEFAGLVSKLVVILDRDDRVKMFVNCVAKLSDPAKQLVDLFSTKEQQHIDHVRKTLAKLSDFPKDRKLHDFSKDQLYFFVTTSNFDCRVKCEGMNDLFKMEVNRHFLLEPHHEQYERMHNKEISSDDIREMAIDRMSRSIQGNQGAVDMDNIANYVPNFPLGDNKKKRELFNQYIHQYKNITEETYRTMFSSKEL
jgi:hypothetical protein